MLIEFRVSNHRSILGEQVLSFEAANVGDPDDPRPRVVAGHNKKVLPVAAIYGANASGKSNLLLALTFMADAVRSSHRLWAPDDGVPRAPFAWGGGPATPSLFEVTHLINGVRFQYGFVADDRSFLEEWLYAWPRGRKQVWFERDGSSVAFGDALRGERQAAASVMRPNSLFLASAVQNNLMQLAPIWVFFAANGVTYAPGITTVQHLAWFNYAFHELTVHRPILDSLHDLLVKADLGIDAFRSETDAHGTRRVEVRHVPEGHWLPLEEESRGTQGLFDLAPSVLDALWTGRLLLVDELEASLHPSLAAAVVEMFQGPSNTRGAQLLFTTHDTTLLGTAVGAPALRRDQVWLTEKNPAGATELYPLTDYKPRKSENLERGYLQGRYGAVPFLGDLAPSLAHDGE